MSAPISTNYRHVDKVATPLGVTGSMKWYDLHEPGRVIEASVRTAASAAVAGLIDSDDVGFIILHWCGVDVFLLLVCRWRNDNEIWEAVFVKQGDSTFTPVGNADHTRATYCVWELAIVNAERLAWIDLLRGESDLQTYLATTYSGPA